MLSGSKAYGLLGRIEQTTNLLLQKSGNADPMPVDRSRLVELLDELRISIADQLAMLEAYRWWEINKQYFTVACFRDSLSNVAVRWEISGFGPFDGIDVTSCNSREFAIVRAYYRVISQPHDDPTRS